MPGGAGILLTLSLEGPGYTKRQQDAGVTKSRRGQNRNSGKALSLTPVAGPAFGESPANLDDQLFALLLVTRQRPLYHREGRVGRPNVFDLHELAFELLVILKKALYH